MEGNICRETGRTPETAEVRTYLSHAVERTNDLSPLNSVEMGIWSTIPKPIFFALKLVVADHNSPDVGADDFVDNFVPFRVGTVKLLPVVSIEIASLMNTGADMPIGQFPGAVGMDKRRGWYPNPVVEHTNVKYLNKGSHGRANKPAKEDNEPFHGDWIGVNYRAIPT